MTSSNGGAQNLAPSTLQLYVESTQEFADERRCAKQEQHAEKKRLSRDHMLRPMSSLPPRERRELKDCHCSSASPDLSGPPKSQYGCPVLGNRTPCKGGRRTAVEGGRDE
ncbi:hypothetical protein OPV22_004675 [Ensete ventricosum]|uniref:Uncharacterized protein n=1 Tax=Ensete ventricosum TaxID=4639 RepID=A0AAV8RKI4_ENSVE|nr:hypothetical protein OPV22_004675 [Ensete ventricosum]